MQKYEPVIGLEIHVQLKTNTKIFCGCRVHKPDAEPNTNVCPVCLGYPGVLPVMNEKVIQLCCKAGLLLNCTINRFSKWDRKNYLYPDMPKNYQITQYDQPLCLGGYIPAEIDGQIQRFPLTRIHQEEDVAKNTHRPNFSLIDFNRAGTPLMEIVTEPEIHSPEEAYAILMSLKQILQYGGISDCDQERGNLRCDVNISMRPKGETGLGTKSEIKNMNSFKGIYNALKYEIARQTETLERGGEILQETRRWDPETETTSSMRTKEEAHDYRYFPDPDLMPVVISEEQIEAWKRELPELPAQRRERYCTQLGLPEYDAGVIVADKKIADFFEETIGLGPEPKTVSNWIMGEAMRLLSEREIEIDQAQIRPRALADLIGLIENKTINNNAAKEVFEILFTKGGSPQEIVESEGMAQVSDENALEEWAKRVITENPDSVQDYKNGKEASINYLMGQVMRLSKGKANPQNVIAILKEKLH